MEFLRVFWIRCGCSGLGAGVLDKCECSGECSDVLDKVWVFWSGRGCSRSGYGCSG